MRMSPTQEAAMRMALEALHEIGWSNNTRWQSDRAATVIPALRAALAEPVEAVACEWPSCGCRVDLGEDWKACSPEAALPQNPSTV